MVSKIVRFIIMLIAQCHPPISVNTKTRTIRLWLCEMVVTVKLSLNKEIYYDCDSIVSLFRRGMMFVVAIRIQVTTAKFHKHLISRP